MLAIKSESVGVNMWTRKELKERAKEVLKGNYWKAFIVSIVIGLAGGGSNGGNGGGGGGSASNSHSRNSIVSNISNDNIFSNITFIILIVICILLLISAFRIFLGYSLEVGGRRYFAQSAQYSDNKKCFTFAFYRENYKGIILDVCQ